MSSTTTQRSIRMSALALIGLAIAAGTAWFVVPVEAWSSILSADRAAGPVDAKDAQQSSVTSDAHAGHSHQSQQSVGADDSSVQMSRKARANLGLKIGKAKVGTYIKYVEIPGVITTWPGRTHIMITSPLTGVVNAIDVVRGQLISSGESLFTLRLTHQDLVRLQESFVAQLGQLDVVRREIERLTSIASSGAVAGKTLITRQYERDQLLANISAVRQSLALHGLTDEQVDQIEHERRLVREFEIRAPRIHLDLSLHHDAIPHRQDEDVEHIDGEFVVSSLDVDLGQSVDSGQALLRLSDYRMLLIEGHAFQRDAHLLQRVADSNTRIQAVLERSNSETEIIDDLEITYIDNEVGRQSRALAFFVELENEIERATERSGNRFLSWRYKPGQRLKLRLPEARVENVIVVPSEAIARVGPRRFVFVDRRDHFDRVEVHVESQDSVHAAIANDGAIRPGQLLAVSHAHQLQMAIKNRGGGAVDPHQGHSH